VVGARSGHTDRCRCNVLSIESFSGIHACRVKWLSLNRLLRFDILREEPPKAGSEMPDRQTAASDPRPPCPICKKTESGRPLPTTPIHPRVAYWRCECGAIWATKDGEWIADPWRELEEGPG
jgi:hypothetical protein